MSPASLTSGVWGQRKPDYEVDMKILQGIENLGAPWGSMGRFPDPSRTEFNWNIGALMIWVHTTGYGMFALVDSSLPC
jgi:hypothetical protein